MAEIDNKMYLGDGVYVERTPVGVMLYVLVGKFKENTIFLGENEIKALEIYLISKGLINDNQNLSESISKKD